MQLPQTFGILFGIGPLRRTALTRLSRAGCRWCGRSLVTTDDDAIVCPSCDFPADGYRPNAEGSTAS